MNVLIEHRRESLYAEAGTVGALKLGKLELFTLLLRKRIPTDAV